MWPAVSGLRGGALRGLALWLPLAPAAVRTATAFACISQPGWPQRQEHVPPRLQAAAHRRWSWWRVYA